MRYSAVFLLAFVILATFTEAHNAHKSGRGKGHGHKRPRMGFKDPSLHKGRHKTLWKFLRFGHHKGKGLSAGISTSMAGTHPINGQGALQAPQAKTKGTQEISQAAEAKTAAASANGTCTNPEVRANWKSLSPSNAQSLVAAIKCLQTKPTRTNLVRRSTLYDDYSNVHITQAYVDTSIHYTAQFLPWHRYFVATWIKDIRACGYSGPIPYWNWATDADTLSVPKAAIFNPTTGLGGSAKGTRAGPIATGPFANFRVNSMDGGGFPRTSSHYLARQFNGDAGTASGTMRAYYYNSTIVSGLMALNNYADFRMALEDTPHDALHNSIGGDMQTMYSPNDPMFWMHHIQVDRLWTKWQAQNPSYLTDYSGPIFPDDDTNFDASVTDNLVMSGLAPQVTVADVLNTQGKTLCYTYDA